MQKISRLYVFCLIPSFAILAHAQARPALVEKAVPLAFGETFTIDSKILGEARRINVYVPPGHQESAGTRPPVLYMPDEKHSTIYHPAALKAFREVFRPAADK